MHTQQQRRIGQGLFLNPGSIGVIDARFVSTEQVQLDTWAGYAVLTCERGSFSVAFHHAAYGVERLIHIIRASGRPDAGTMIVEYGWSGRRGTAGMAAVAFLSAVVLRFSRATQCVQECPAVVACTSCLR